MSEGYRKLREWVQALNGNPFITLIVALLATVAALLAIFDAAKANHSRKLTEYVTKGHIVFQSGVSNAANVFAMVNNQTVTNSISACRIEIWNAGDEAVQSTDVGPGLTIQTPENWPIYNLVVSNNFQPSEITISNDFLHGKIHLTWDFLNQNEGVCLDIVYVGSVNAPFKFESHIRDQSKIYDYYTSPPSVTIFASIALSILLIVALYFHSLLFKQLRLRIDNCSTAMEGALYLFVAFIPLILLAGSFVLIAHYIIVMPAPPFGF